MFEYHISKLGKPKTKRGERKIRLTQRALAALHRRKAEQLQEQLSAGASWENKFGLVFTNSLGHPIEANNFLRREFYPLLKRAGLDHVRPRIRFHDRRHAVVTFLLKDGTYSRMVSDYVGHSSVAFTLGKYAYSTPEMQVSAVATMDRLLEAI